MVKQCSPMSLRLPCYSKCAEVGTCRCGMNRGDYSDLLAWAVGANRQVGVRRIDENALLAAAIQHRIAGRFARRLRAEQPVWATPRLLARLAFKQLVANQRIERKLATVCRITTALPSRVLPLGIFKGFSVSLLLRDSAGRRDSDDIDVLAPHADALKSCLLRLGFQNIGASGPHTNADLQGQSTWIDLHNYFPVWSYPTWMRTRPPIPANHPGAWRMLSDIDVKRIHFDDLANNGWSPQDLPGCVLPNPELALLILCAHTFKDYCELRAFHTRLKPPVLLSYVADMVDLADHPGFDKLRFTGLAEQLGAWDAVTWSASIVKSCLGFNNIPVPRDFEVDANDFGQRFPRSVYRGFWVCLDQRVDSVWRAHPALHDIVDSLGYNRMQVYTQPDGPRETKLSRYIWRGSGRDVSDLPVAVNATTADEELRLQLSVKVAPGDARVVSWLDLPRVVHACDFQLLGRTKRERGRGRVVKISICDSWNVRTHALRLKDLGLGRRDREVAALLAVEVYAKSGELNWAALMPLVLIKG